jgi:general secretion pathway protein G
MLACGDAGERAATEALRSLDRGKVTGTRGNMEAIARALQAYALDHSGYPVDGTFGEAVERLVPAHLRAPIHTDAWGHPFTYRSDGGSFTLASPGPDGRPGTDDDVVMVDGRFVQPADHGGP